MNEVFPKNNPEKCVDWFMGGSLRIGQFQTSLFLKWINLPILERIGRKFHTIFQSRCFSLEF